MEYLCMMALCDCSYDASYSKVANAMPVAYSPTCNVNLETCKIVDVTLTVPNPTEEAGQ